jgi:mono/diheme cytochrome c family protein
MKHLVLPILAVSMFSASADEAQKAKLIEIGKASFATCMACHGPDGQGVALGPDKKMAPTLVGSTIANGDPAVFALSVLKGIQKDPTNTAILGVMAPLEAALDDEKLAGVMTYVRNSFGNKTGDVVTKQMGATALEISETRPKVGTTLTAEELDELHNKNLAGDLLDPTTMLDPITLEPAEAK